MAIILSLETSTTVCSVALHEDGRLLALAEIHQEQSHAAKLAVLIKEVKTLAGVKTSQINAVSVSSGPGSYTGLRIGTSTAKGLCYAAGLPLIAVNTLELLAYQFHSLNVSQAMLCPMIDARRMEVYCMVADNTLRVLQPVAAKVIDETSFQEYLDKGPVLFFGNGAAKCAAVIKHSHATFVDGIHPSASALGRLAFKKFENRQFEDLVHYEPYYLKEFMIKKPAGEPIAANK